MVANQTALDTDQTLEDILRKKKRVECVSNDY